MELSQFEHEFCHIQYALMLSCPSRGLKTEFFLSLLCEIFAVVIMRFWRGFVIASLPLGVELL